MKKITAGVTAIAIVFILTACGAKLTEEHYTEPIVNQAAEETSAAEITTEESTTKDTDDVQIDVKWQLLDDDIKRAYLSTILEYREKYGAELIMSDNEWPHGVACSVLFDWDQNGVPELFIWYSSDKTRDRDLEANVVTNLDVFTYQDEAVNQILSAYPGRHYWQTSAVEITYLTIGKEDNTVYLRLEQSLDPFMEERGTMYGYKDGKIIEKRYYAKVPSVQDGGERDLFDYYEFDGNEVSEEAYKHTFLNEDDELFIAWEGVKESDDYNDLLEYLSGERQSYSVWYFARWSSPTWAEGLVQEYR